MSGIPDAPFTLTLSAEDEVGNTLEQEITVSLVNPECVPVEGDVELRFGPNVRHNVVGTVQAGSTVVVTARDGSGQWLQIPLPGDTIGWGRRDLFTCADTFNPDALRVELNVPPTPTPEPTATPTPSPTPSPSPTRRSTPTKKPSNTPEPTAT